MISVSLSKITLGHICETWIKRKKKEEVSPDKGRKIKRSRKRQAKLTEEHNKDMAAQREGMTYETRVVFKAA